MSQLIGRDLFVGKLVRLAAPREDDAPLIAEWSNDSEYLRQLELPPARPFSLSQVNEQEKKSAARENAAIFKVRTIDEDKLIGEVGAAIVWSHQFAWLFAGIGDPAFRGKGYGTEAIRLLINYCFRELNLRRVQLNVFSYNTRAIRAYEKIGFVVEGRAREFAFRDGQAFDDIAMGLLRREWDIERMERIREEPIQ